MLSRFFTSVFTLVFLSPSAHATTVNETFAGYLYSVGSVGYQEDGVVGQDKARALAYSHGVPDENISDVQLNAYQVPEAPRKSKSMRSFGTERSRVSCRWQLH